MTRRRSRRDLLAATERDSAPLSGVLLRGAVAAAGALVTFGVLGTAAIACAVPLFLALVVQSLSLSPAGTAAVVGAYGGVVAALLLAVTVLTAIGRDVAAGRIAAHQDRLATVAGALLVLAGVGQVGVAAGVV